MKTLKNFTPEELRVFQAKSAIAFNKKILDDILVFVFNSVNDIDTLEMIYDKLDSFLESLDVTTISKSLNNYDNQNSKDSTHNLENS